MPTTMHGLVRMAWEHPANRGRRARALAAMAGWQAWKRLVRRPRDLSVFGGMSFRAYRDSTQPGRFLYFGGLPDYEEMTFMKRYLRPGDGFIDGGANEGMFSLLAAQLVGPSGEVHAFEAVPTYVKRLQHNLRANSLDWVTVHDMAIGAEQGSVRFFINGTGSRLRTDADPPQDGVQVGLGRLDELLPERAYAMGKLDVEGTEHLALSGASRLIARGEPAVWMLELVDKFLHRFGSSSREVREWLQDHGYDVVMYDPARNQLVPAPQTPSAGPDVLAVHRRSRQLVQARLSGRV
ncbi:FkbM family methyltransferase [Streptomyces sp. HUCO-GS316]|uniref:FkbM family methyltransferase n=1 Tax=Streptomyces sp. HUCO-GS316 TaxID=2692198 RepID=UPI00136FE41A|nr:FkbM family methyltransferase [Streptomyces sp. HUCO-GS316]MXM63467.1 FkbM family methyltransferase [Streptomyces sp. HUCO-GS316]